LNFSNTFQTASRSYLKNTIRCFEIASNEILKKEELICMRILLPLLKRQCGSLFGGIWCLCMLTTSTAAAANQVTSTADSGAGSLRQAVADANGALVLCN